MSSEVRIEGLDKLLHKINNVVGLRAAKAALQAGAVYIKGRIAVYPAATIANSPSNPSGRWYERGYGTRWALRTGGLGGRKTSETLARKWTTASEAGGLRQVVGNNVSYGEFVQGDKQNRIHAGRGWKTAEQVAKEETDTVVNFVKSEIDKALSS